MLLATVQVMAAVFALKLRLLVAGEVQRIADLTGATSTAAFLSHLTLVRREDASAEVRLANDLDRRFPLLGEALAKGLMSPEQLKVCISALRKLPKDLSDDQREACQRFLIDAAQRLSPPQLKAVGRKLWEVIDPEGAEKKEGKALEDEEELARAKAYFRSWSNGDGTTGFRGKLPDVQAAILIKAIQAFAAPRRRSNPNVPTSQPDDVRHPESGTGADDPCARDAGSDDPCVGDPEVDDLDDGESPEEKQTGKVVPYPVKLGHGLMDLVERIPADLLPGSGGVNASVVVTMTLQQLHDGLGVASLDTGTDISAAQARRLACEAGIIPAVLGGSSEVLDLGRARRLYTRAQRVAMGIRDQTCAAEGCSRPTSWCAAHHKIPWSHGGRTDLEDGALLCEYHHGLAHSSRWTATWHGHRVRFRRAA